MSTFYVIVLLKKIIHMSKYPNIIICILLSILPIVALGTTITVTDCTDNYTFPTVGSLRYSILHANEGDSIVFDITDTIVLDTSIFIHQKSLHINGRVGQQKTCLRANWNGQEDDSSAFRVMDIQTGSSNKVSIKYLSIENGYDTEGGGIYAKTISKTDSIIISNCAIKKNAAVLRGGGICSYGNVLIKGCAISENKTKELSQSEGGGVYLNGGIVDKCVINRNFAHMLGGGIYINSGQLFNSTVIGNRSGRGAAVDLSNFNPSCNRKQEYEVINCIVLYNKCDGIVGQSNSGYTNFITIAHCNVLYNYHSAFKNLNGSSKIYNCIVFSKRENIMWGNEYTNCAFARLHRGQICFDELPFITKPDAGSDSIWGTEDDIIDMRLKPGSSCINNGIAIDFCSKDMFGNPRSQSVRPDIGVYESPYTDPPQELYEEIIVTNNSTDYDKPYSFPWAIIHAAENCHITFDDDYIIPLRAMINDIKCRLTIDGGEHTIIFDGENPDPWSEAHNYETAMFQLNQSAGICLKNLQIRNCKGAVETVYDSVQDRDYGFRMQNVFFNNTVNGFRIYNGVLQNCVFDNNSDDGLYAFKAVSSKLYSCVFENFNTVQHGLFFGNCTLNSCVFDNITTQDYPAVKFYVTDLFNCTLNNVSGRNKKVCRSENTTFVNSIIYNDSPSEYSIDCFKKNAVYHCALNTKLIEVSPEIIDTITLSESPFDPADRLHLRSASRCIDAGRLSISTQLQGIVTVPETTGDAQGKVRIQGKSIDLGAFETGSKETINVEFIIETLDGFLELYPITCNNTIVYTDNRGNASYFSHPKGDSLKWEVSKQYYNTEMGVIPAITADTTIHVRLLKKVFKTLTINVLYNDKLFEHSQLTIENGVDLAYPGTYNLTGEVGSTFTYIIGNSKSQPLTYIEPDTVTFTLTETDTVFTFRYYQDSSLLNCSVVKKSGIPIAGAKVSIQSHTAVTDANGHVQFHDIPENEQLELSIIADDYYTFSDSVLIHSDSTITLMLKDKEYCRFEISVINENLTSIQGVEISIDEKVYTSDANGIIVSDKLDIMVPHSYQVLKAPEVYHETEFRCKADTTTDTVYLLGSLLTVRNSSSSRQVPFSLPWCLERAKAGDSIYFADNFRIILDTPINVTNKIYIDGATKNGKVTIEGGMDSANTKGISIGSIMSPNIKDVIFKNARGRKSPTVVLMGTATDTSYLQGCVFENLFSSANACVALVNVATFVLKDCVFRNNKVAETAIGSLMSYNFGTIEITDCSFSNNISREGGAMNFVNNAGIVDIQRSSFSNNVALKNGGAIYTKQEGTIKISNCILSDNKCGQNGGAVYFEQVNNTGRLEVVNSTIVRNESNTNGISALYYTGFTVAGSVSISNSVFWGGSTYIGPSASVSDFELLQCASDESFANFPHTLLLDTLNNSPSGPNFTSTNFQNIPLQWLPKDGSVLIDAGTADTSNLSVGIKDFANENRFSGIIDIGAFEKHTGKDVQLVKLKHGWNLMSTYLQLVQNDISSVFKTVDVSMVKTLDAFWNANQPAFLNRLQTIDPGKGYMVYSNTDTTLILKGVLKQMNYTPGNGNIQLLASPIKETAIKDLYNSSNCRYIKTYDGFWLPEGTLNSIDSFKPGEAYFLKL